MRYKILITKIGREYLSNYTMSEISEAFDTFYKFYLRMRLMYAVVFLVPVILQVITKHPIFSVVEVIVTVSLIGHSMKGIRTCRNYFLRSN